MEIRQLDIDDAQNYLSLRLEALQNSPYAFASSYEEEKDDAAEKYRVRFHAAKNSFTFGAFKGTQLAGVITLVSEQKVKLKHRANIVAMYVKPEERGKGIGKALINEAIQKARSMGGIEQLYLTVVTSNEAAKKLYSSMGFEVFGKEEKALKIDDVYYDEAWMVLFL
ncbi:N-acetyltransferase family protein [Virgibacillus oceani]